MSSDGIRRAEPPKEFCRSLGVSYDSGRRAVRTGKLKTIRFGHRVLVAVHEIERVQREGLEGGGDQDTSPDRKPNKQRTAK
jgi:hypothetical protein